MRLSPIALLTSSVFALFGTGAESRVSGGTIPGSIGRSVDSLGVPAQAIPTAEPGSNTDVGGADVAIAADGAGTASVLFTVAGPNGGANGLDDPTGDPPHPGASPYVGGVTLPTPALGGSSLTQEHGTGVGVVPGPGLDPDPDSSGRASAEVAAPEPAALTLLFSGLLCLAGRASVGRRRHGGATN